MGSSIIAADWNYSFKVGPIVSEEIAADRLSLINADSETIDFCAVAKELLEIEDCGSDADGTYCAVSVIDDPASDEDTTLFVMRNTRRAKSARLLLLGRLGSRSHLRCIRVIDLHGIELFV